MQEEKCSYKNDFRVNIDILANKSKKNKLQQSFQGKSHKFKSESKNRGKMKLEFDADPVLCVSALQFTCSGTCSHQTRKRLCQSNFRAFDWQSTITKKVNGRPEAVARGVL